jgi:hypothetical protein
MDDIFNWKASQRTDDELYERINNRANYLPDTIEASVTELKNRGVTFDDDELLRIENDVQRKRSQANTMAGYDSLFNNADKVRQVKDTDAPVFYSKRAIYGFSIVFTVLFGAILFAINVWNSPKRNRAFLVIFYGFAYIVAQVMVGERLHAGTPYAVVSGILGAYPLNYFFWNQYLGKATLYRVKPVWIPLTIGVVIFGAFILLVLYADNMR